MRAADVVHKFGGQTAIARLLKINQSAISYWVKQDTIPAKWHAQLMALAIPRGIPLTLAELGGEPETGDRDDAAHSSNALATVPDTTEDGASKFLFYAAGEDAVKVRVMLGDETVWASQKGISEIFGTTRENISMHLANVFAEGELDVDAVCKDFLLTAVDGKKYNYKLYNLDAIISIGYRVNSYQATQFRKWATTILRDFLVKGFALDDERLKQGHQAFGKDYFDELLERIREIRTSERRFYQKITDIYAQCSIDYDKNSPISHAFYATVQDKLHYAIHGHTSAELIYKRADATKRHMGLSTFKNATRSGRVTKLDVTIGKNYLSADEMDSMRLLVSGYLDMAEGFAKRRRAMTMKEWAEKLDDFIRFNEYDVLDGHGRIARDDADHKAIAEFEKFRVIQDRAFKSDFDKLVDETRSRKRKPT